MASGNVALDDRRSAYLRYSNNRCLDKLGPSSGGSTLFFYQGSSSVANMVLARSLSHGGYGYNKSHPTTWIFSPKAP